MNKIVVSFGLAALGASSIQVALAEDVSPLPPKLWSVTGTLNGFYDDNINGAPSGTNKVGSFGFEVAPGVGLNWVTDQTTVKLGYAYSLRYFDKERFQTEGHDSQEHTFEGSLLHKFSERYSMGVQDSFVVGQEPDMLRSQVVGGLPLGPLPGNNIRNYGSIVFNGALTPIFGLEAGYDNQWFDYADHGGNAFDPSLSGLLDRIEQTVHLEGQWRVLPETRAVLGYQFGVVNYTGNEAISLFSPFLMSDDRDNRSHYVYVGLTQQFQPDLSGAVRVGARFIDFYNANENEISPFLRANLNYTYAPESYVGVGASYDFTPALQATSRGAETACIFGNVRHRIAPKLFGGATAQFQNSVYSGGSFDGQTEQLYTVGVNLEYFFNPFLSAHAGYNFDAVSSQVNSDYQRNRVYIGVTASY